MNSIEGIQKLPESQRKIIFWAIFILVVFFTVSFWLFRAKRKLQGLRPGEIIETMKPPISETENMQKQEIEQELESLQELKEIIEAIDNEQQIIGN